MNYFEFWIAAQVEYLVYYHAYCYGLNFILSRILHLT